LGKGEVGVGWTIDGLTYTSKEWKVDDGFMKEGGHINLMAFPNPYFNQLPYGYPYSSLPTLPPFLPPPFPYDSLRHPHPLLSPSPFFHQQNNYFPDPQVNNPFF
jgi:hypothetical protein